jgi:hypothetical protein
VTEGALLTGTVEAEATQREPMPLPRALRWMAPAWPLWAAINVYVFVTGHLAQHGTLGRVYPDGTVEGSYRLDQAAADSLARAGIGVETYPWILLGFAVLIAGGLLVLGGLLVRRAGTQLLPVLLGWALPAVGTLYFLPPELTGGFEPGDLPFVLVKLAVGITLAPLLVMFPNGRPVPRWAAWLLLVVTPIDVLTVFDELAEGPPTQLLSDVGWISLAATAFLIGAQVYRYIRVSGPVERRQTKWVLGGFVFLALSGALIIGTDQMNDADQLNPTGQLIAAIGNLPLFVALAIAVGRYRLWEIDRLLSRAVAYLIVTVVLAATYGLVVVGLAALLGRDGNGLAVAAATLVVAAAFGPVRRRVQDRVDRRFDRRRYDAVRTVRSFTARLREEVDLDVLADELLGVVHSTTQPTHASLWLRTRP